MGWFLPSLPVSPGSPLVLHHGLSMQPHFSLLGKPGLLVPMREEGREEIQPPDPPSMLVQGPARVQQCTLQRPRLHHHWGGWRPRKRPPDWVSARLLMPFNGCCLGRKCSEGILEDMGYLTNVSK